VKWHSIILCPAFCCMSPLLFCFHVHKCEEAVHVEG
jgi:hypothetical protein